jgi:hypothetical protein
MRPATTEWFKAGALDFLYIDARYPGDLGLLPDGAPLVEDARQFYDFSRTFYERVMNLLQE